MDKLFTPTLISEKTFNPHVALSLNKWIMNFTCIFLIHVISSSFLLLVLFYPIQIDVVYVGFIFECPLLLHDLLCKVQFPR
jgi:hypothetical protein